MREEGKKGRAVKEEERRRKEEEKAVKEGDEEGSVFVLSDFPLLSICFSVLAHHVSVILSSFDVMPEGTMGKGKRRK